MTLVLARLGKSGEGDFAAVLGKLHGIAENIDQHITNAQCICHDIGVGRAISIDNKLNIPVFHKAMGNSNNRIYDLGDTYRHRLIFNFAAFYTADIEHIVNQAHQIAGALLNLLQTAAHLRLRLLAQRNIRKANDSVHRRSDIMRHIVQESCFGIIRRLRRPERLLHSLPVLLLIQIFITPNDEARNNSEQDENQQHQARQQINIARRSSCTIRSQLQMPFAIAYLKGIRRCIIRQRCAGAIHRLKARIRR